jgi:hypothetical protein
VVPDPAPSVTDREAMHTELTDRIVKHECFAAQLWIVSAGAAAYRGRPILHTPRATKKQAREGYPAVIEPAN